jgi:hypothetical protein
MTRPLSDADSVVGRKAKNIRRAREQQRQREIEELTAIARQQKDAFEAATEMPQPVWLRTSETDEVPKTEEVGERKRATRMFVKTAKWRDLEEMPPDQEFLLDLNPNITDKALKRAVEYSIRYPTFA